MNNSFRLMSSVAAMCLFAAFAPASAVTMQAVYSGSVASGTDLTDIFGLGSVLDGAAYTLTFTYNPSRFGVVHQTSATSNVARGGPFDILGSVAPIYGADLVINGITKHISANGAGYVGNFNPLSTYNSAFHSADYQSFNQDFTFEDYVSNNIGGFGLAIPLDLETNYHVMIDSLVSNGQFDFNVFDEILGDYSVHTFGSFNATELKVSTVPLPGAFSMFAVGLFGLGSIARKRAGRKLDKASQKTVG